MKFISTIQCDLHHLLSSCLIFLMKRHLAVMSQRIISEERIVVVRTKNLFLLNLRRRPTFLDKCLDF